MRCTAQSPVAYCSQQRCITAAQRSSSAALEEQPANVQPPAGGRPLDSEAVLCYLNFKRSAKWKYAFWPQRSGRIGAVMLMQGCGILLAFEVWPSPPHEGPPSFHSLRQVASSGLFAPCRKNTCYRVCVQEALMSCVVVLMLPVKSQRQ